ncbi:hypothetical protein U9R62_10465 [Cylindrospermopsis raciborskii DSH]
MSYNCAMMLRCPERMRAYAALVEESMATSLSSGRQYSSTWYRRR